MEYLFLYASQGEAWHPNKHLSQQNRTHRNVVPVDICQHFVNYVFLTKAQTLTDILQMSLVFKVNCSVCLWTSEELFGCLSKDTTGNPNKMRRLQENTLWLMC